MGYCCRCPRCKRIQVVYIKAWICGHLSLKKRYHYERPWVKEDMRIQSCRTGIEVTLCVWRSTTMMLIIDVAVQSLSEGARRKASVWWIWMISSSVYCYDWNLRARKALLSPVGVVEMTSLAKDCWAGCYLDTGSFRKLWTSLISYFVQCYLNRCVIDMLFID